MGKEANNFRIQFSLTFFLIGRHNIPALESRSEGLWLPHFWEQAVACENCYKEYSESQRASKEGERRQDALAVIWKRKISPPSFPTTSMTHSHIHKQSRCMTRLTLSHTLEELSLKKHSFASCCEGAL